MENKEKGCRWHFGNQIGGVDDGPNNAMQDNFKKLPYASLIRESIQNSLDAVLDDTRPMAMSYTFGKLAVADYPHLVELQEHIQGCLDYFPDNENARDLYGSMLAKFDSMGDAIGYIRISDSNTTGMAYRDDDRSNPFYSFVRARGVSSKAEASSGGSYGYGKAAFFNISPLQTVIVSTRTAEGQCFFEGVASLCTHLMQGEVKVAVGYYDNNDGKPTCREEDIPERFRRSEPGSDIYILGLNDTDNSVVDEAIKATLRHFWMAVEKGKLEVTINDFIDINRDTLPDHMEDYMVEPDDKPGSTSRYNPRPYWEAVHNAGSDDSRYYHITRQLPVLGHSELYVSLVKNAPDKVIYMRKPLMFVYAKKEQSENGFYGVFVCDDPTGNEYLRKMENSAHDEWDYHNWKNHTDGGLKNNPKGKEVRNEIRQFIREVKDQIFGGKQRDTQDIVGLHDLCYIPFGMEDEQDMYSQALSEQSSGESSQKGEGSLTTSMADVAGEHTQPSVKSNIGKVMVETNDSLRHGPDDNGDLLGGHASGRPPKKKGGGLSSTQINGRFSSATHVLDGVTYKEIPVRYRSFAISEDGIAKHMLVVYSDYDVLNGRIDLVIGGEQSNDKVPIKRSSIGTIKGNSLCDLNVKQGKNVFEVVFVDNMRHAVKLSAYEAE